MKEKLVVYTMAIGGDYDLQPVTATYDVDYICFTDQQNLEACGWTILQVSPLLPGDTFRSSRDFKVRPHCWLANYTRSIYIDSSVHLHQDPLKIWDYLVPNELIVFGGFFHSYRSNLLEEFFAVGSSKLDYKRVIEEQLQVYRTHNIRTLVEKPVWGGFLARRHNNLSCINAMEIWFAHILRYSRRDQLSLPIALSNLSSNQINLVSDDIFSTVYHSWPMSKKAKPAGYTVEETFHDNQEMNDHPEENSNRKNIFIDCGANDGKSAIWFRANKDPSGIYHYVVIEPHPDFSDRLNNLGMQLSAPVTYLQGCAWVEDGEQKLYVDDRKTWHGDWEGSSLFATKTSGKMNLERPLTVQTYDLTRWLKTNTKPDDFIILKLDCEGAEYPILEHMITSGKIDYINEIYAEWHYDKIRDFTEEQHNRIIAEIKKRNIPLYQWIDPTAKGMSTQRI